MWKNHDFFYLNKLSQYGYFRNGNWISEISKLRHNGIPIPFIDYSESILLGLFFACYKNLKSDGILYCYNIGSSLAKKILENKIMFKFLNYYSSTLYSKIESFNTTLEDAENSDKILNELSKYYFYGEHAKKIAIQSNKLWKFYKIFFPTLNEYTNINGKYNKLVESFTKKIEIKKTMIFQIKKHLLLILEFIKKKIMGRGNNNVKILLKDIKIKIDKINEKKCVDLFVWKKYWNVVKRFGGDNEFFTTETGSIISIIFVYFNYKRGFRNKKADYIENQEKNSNLGDVIEMELIDIIRNCYWCLTFIFTNLSDIVLYLKDYNDESAIKQKSIMIFEKSCKLINYNFINEEFLNKDKDIMEITIKSNQKREILVELDQTYNLNSTTILGDKSALVKKDIFGIYNK